MNQLKMDLKVKSYLERAENELILAKANFELSIKEEIKQMLKIPSGKTFFNDVISESYYSIFYSAKAYLLSQGIETEAPEEHKKTYEEFKKLVDKGAVDVELLKIYQQLLTRADTLLKIFQTEKSKRGKFTYRILPQANNEPAKESLTNAETFFKHIIKLCK